MNNNISSIAWLSFRESIRQRVIYGVFAFGLIMVAITCFFTSFIGFDVVKVIIDFMLMTISIGCLMIIFFLCMPGLIKDIKEQRIYFILSSPVRRSEYILGKFFGYSMVLFACLCILSVPAFLIIKFYIIRYPAYTPVHFGWAKLALACFFKFYSAVIFLSVVFLIWNLMSTGFLVSTVSIIVYLIGQNINAVRNIAIMSKKMSILSQRFILFVSWIFPNLGYFNLNTYASYGVDLPEFYTAKIFTYGLSYISIAVILSVFLFKRRDL